MSQYNSDKKLRVLFGHTGPNDLTGLSRSLSAGGEFDAEEYIAPSDDIWKKAISTSADVVMLFFPEIDDAWERCVRRILRGAFSSILLLTYSPVNADFADAGNRVDTYLIPRSKTDFEDVFPRVRHLGQAKKALIKSPSAYKPPIGAAPDAASGAMANLAFEGKVVAVGASTGGTEALTAFFRGLSPRMPGIVVVQHMPPVFTAMFADRLNKELPFTVTEAADNVLIKPGTIHIAPGDKHLRIKKVGSSFYTSVSGTNKVSGHCPSVDVLFESVAEAAGSNASGVILTGMGGDGAAGLLKMRQRGAFTVGQDEASCVVYGMPRKAFELGAVSVQADLDDIASVLMKHLA